ncbi:MAG: VOC family protein [Planctomycetes bacterium]|nr:VOC family protein [Planctomycetota bacterium]MCP4770457.1 VOC family protein [Planctomycetota bacterium]MCP4859897.1 VOC family protein [Planctomycetota bacterium]
MLTSNNVKESVAFYRDICGFEMSESWSDGPDPMWANMDLNGQSIMVECAMEPDKVGDMCKDEPLEEA